MTKYYIETATSAEFGAHPAAAGAAPRADCVRGSSIEVLCLKNVLFICDLLYERTENLNIVNIYL